MVANPSIGETGTHAHVAAIITANS